MKKKIVFVDRKANSYRKSGFTLVEVMVAFFICVIVFSSVFMIWSRVQHGIVRSTTRQTLLNELRNVSNYMQNDFKSINFDEDTFKLTEGSDGKSFSLTFEKFKEAEDGKLLHDAVQKVTYELKNSVLTRTAEKHQVLSVHCDGVSIKRATADASGIDLENFDEDFKAGREAKLDIEITGKKPIPGIREDLYYVEKTSIVMRNEYSKKVNKNYVSTFDLIKKESDELVKDGSTVFFPNGGIDPEALKVLSDEALDDLEKTQKEMVDMAKKQLEDINKDIDNTDDGRKWYQKIGDFFTSGEQGGELVSRCKNELKNAETVEDVEKVKAELKTWSDDEEIMHKSKSYTGYDRLSDKDKELFQVAYDMKVQDRLIKKTNEKMAEEAEEGETVEKQQLSIDQYKESLNGAEDIFKDAKGNIITVQNSDNDGSNSAADSQRVIEFYEQMDVAWMDEPEYEKDMNVYSAAKSLLAQADTKIDVLKTKKIYDENIKLIADERESRK